MKKISLIVLLISFFLSGFLSAANTDVRLNSLGFFPNNDKIATIHWTSAPAAWDLLTSPGNVTVVSGTFSAAMSDAQTGENNNLYQANFSSYTAAGNYYLNVPGVGVSSVFPISVTAYNAPFVPVFKAMYEWRCGTAVTVTYGGNTFSHAACHTNDAYDDFIGGTGAKIASGKGWHDAGDYGKYTVNAGITMGMLFDAWEMFGTKINSLAYGLPSTAAGYPEFLEELKWETDWLLTMKAADGSVYDKVSSVDFDAFEMPELDTSIRYFWGYGNVGTAETGLFCAMMAMASRNFQPYDAAYATTCLNAATSAYNYLTSHLTNTTANVAGCNTGNYTGSDANAARLWAAVEMWETTGTAVYLTDAETRINGMATKIDTDWDWAGQKNLGMFTYLLSSRTGKTAATYNAVYNSLITAANSIVTSRNSHAYGRPLGTNYYWGCNGAVARQAMILQIANQLSPNVSYLNTALDAIGYLFGRNMHDRSYVTQVGINPPMNPHHRPSGGDGITNPWPGYMVGGSPGGRQDPVLTLTPAGLPAAQYWADQQGSYSSNEVAINWQGALIYAMAGFIGSATTPTFTPTPTMTRTATMSVTGTPPTSTVTPTISQTYTNTPVPTPGLVNSDCVQGQTYNLTDGNLNDPIWQTGTWTNVTRSVEGTTGAVSARFKSRWDSGGLIVGVDVTDPALCNGNPAASWYNDDAVEIYIDANNNHGTTYDAYDFQFSIRYGDPVVREENGHVGAVTAVTYQTAGGYSAEFYLPWASLGIAGGSGTNIGFDVGIDHNETCGATRTGVLMWNGTTNDWTNTSAFGENVMLSCGSTPTFTPTSTRTATSPATVTFTPTYTRTFTFTSTAVNTATYTSTNTATKVNSATYTNTVTQTLTVSFTRTVTPTVTNTVYQSPTNTLTATQSSTGTPPTWTFTPTFTLTHTVTETFTATAQDTATPTFTDTPQDTATLTATQTFTIVIFSPTFTFTATKTLTYTQTPTYTRTVTLLPSSTLTPTLTFTPTSTSPSLPTATDTPVILLPTDTPTPAEAKIWPCPINPDTQDLYVTYDLTGEPTAVKFRVYTKAFRLVKSVDILGTVPAVMNCGKVNREYLTGLSNGLYLYVIDSTVNGVTKRSPIKEFIIIK